MLQRNVLRLFGLVLLALGGAATAAAEGLVQLRLEGAIEATSPVAGEAGIVHAGHLVEVEVGAMVLDRQNGGLVERIVTLHLHLAAGTTGAELAQLVQLRLARAGIVAEGTRADDEAGSVWVDRATYVHVRAGSGLVPTISCVEGPPESVMVLPPSTLKLPGQVTVTASSVIVMKDRDPIRQRIVLVADLLATISAAEAATALWELGNAQECLSSRPGANAWSPSKMANGAELTGISVVAAGGGDWCLEVRL